MQPFSSERSSQPAAQPPGGAHQGAAQDRPSPCNDPELRQAIHRLRITLDLLPE